MNKWLKILIAVLFVAAIGFGAYKGVMRVSEIKETNANAVVSFEDMNKSTLTSYNLKSAEGVKNILLVGSDKRGEETGYGRSDSMVIATIGSKDSQLKLTSLLGDSYVDIPGYGKNRLSMAFSIGGVSLLYETIASNFGIQLDHYAIMEFNEFVKAIDKMGGVVVTVSEKDASYLQSHYTTSAGEVAEGDNLLNGTQALAYVRIKQDGARDFGRAKRQRQVLKSLCSQMTKTSVDNMVTVISDVMKSVESDMSINDAKDYLALILALSNNEILEKTLPTDDAYEAKAVKGSTVYEIDIEKCKSVLSDFIFNPVEKMQDETAE